MIGKPILRVGKIKRFGKACPTSVDGHLSRTRPTENADPEKLKNNVWICGGPGEIKAGISKVLAKARIDEKALRKDATLANDVLLSISPEWFRPQNPDRSGSWKPEKLAAFREQAEGLLRKEFGARLVAAVLHLDEATPHIQAIVVPIVKRDEGKFVLSGRDYFGPKKLKALQDAWQRRLEPLGVGPREIGSTARHTTLKTYYSALQRAPEVPQALPPSRPPMRAMLPGGSEAMATWQKVEATKVAKRQKPLAAAAAKGMLYEAEKRSGEAKEAQLREQYRRVGSLRDELSKTSDQLELTKSQISKLRGIPIAEVAEVLGFTGEIGKRENSIDLVKRVGELSFEEATRWLAVAFGPAAAGAAVREHTSKVAPPSPPLSAADKIKAVAVRSQLDALDAPGYRLTIMTDRDGEKIGRNLGKTKDGQPEKIWTKAEVLSLLPRLTSENARGGNVFITPLDGRVHHALIDDLRADDLAKLKGLGYSPSTVSETSPGNHQVVIKIPTSAVPTSAVNEWFKAMNRQLGDEKITGLIHPMRLAGFQNRKSKYEDNGRYPFVRILEAARTLCSHAQAVVAGIAAQMTASKTKWSGPNGP